MKIVVASKNPVKVAAVTELIASYELLRSAEVTSREAPSNVSNQPLSLSETIAGAKNRAKTAFENCDYSFGIEAGLTTVPETITGYMNVTVCAIFDGKTYTIGISSAFEWPSNVTKMVVEDGLEIDKAYHKSGLTENERIGYAEGGVGQLTRGRLTRKDYTKEAIRMALLPLENRELYNL